MRLLLRESVENLGTIGDIVEVKDGYGRNKPTRYHRITTYSKRIIFVIDISNSMATPILVKEGKDSSLQPAKKAASRTAGTSRGRRTFRGVLRPSRE